METKKLKSHNPTFHDNTDENLILVPPHMLENRLIPFEDYTKIRGSIISNIGLAFTFLTAIITSDFRDIFGFRGSSIQGAFISGFIVMLVIICRQCYKLYKSPVKDRKSIVNGMLQVKREEVIKKKGK